MTSQESDWKRKLYDLKKQGQSQKEKSRGYTATVRSTLGFMDLYRQQENPNLQHLVRDSTVRADHLRQDARLRLQEFQSQYNQLPITKRVTFSVWSLFQH